VRVCKPKEELGNGSPANATCGGEQRSRRLSGKLLEAFTLLCQAGEKFVSYLCEGRQQGSGPAADGQARRARCCGCLIKGCGEQSSVISINVISSREQGT
jgi:hypothetical protein